jgi:hypothetical protein
MDKLAHQQIIDDRITAMVETLLPNGAGTMTSTRLETALRKVATVAFGEGERYALQSLLTTQDVAAQLGVTERRVRAIAQERHARLGIGWQVPTFGYFARISWSCYAQVLQGAPAHRSSVSLRRRSFPVTSELLTIHMGGQNREECLQPGEVFRHRSSKRILFVLKSSARLEPDAGSLGGAPDDEWLFSLECRPATEEEARPILETEEENRQYRQKQQQQANLRAQEEAAKRAECWAAKAALPDLLRGLYYSGEGWSFDVLDSTEYACSHCQGTGIKEGRNCGYCRDHAGRDSGWGAMAPEAVALNAPGWWTVFRCRMYDGSYGMVWTNGASAQLYANKNVVEEALRRRFEKQPGQYTVEQYQEWGDVPRSRYSTATPGHRFLAGLPLEPEGDET